MHRRAPPPPVRMRDVLWALRGHSAALALDFAFTIAVFPSVTADICSVANPATQPPCYPRVSAGRLAGRVLSLGDPEVCCLQTLKVHIPG